METRPPVVVLGAGLAGLTAAHYLHRHGINVRVYEASDRIAGLARSALDPDGFTYDCGTHFINSRLAAAVGISADCTPMPRYDEAFRYRDRSYRYPFGFAASPRFMASALAAGMRRYFVPRSENIKEHFENSMGTALSNDIILPLIEAWSGAAAEELSPAIAEKFSTGIVQAMWLRTVARLSRRNVAIGYSHEVPESPHVCFVYPNGGVGAVCELLAEPLRDRIVTGCPVESIEVENERVTSVTIRGRRIRAAAVVSTAPLPVLAKLIRGTNRLDFCGQFHYRPMVFVNLRFSGSKVMNHVVTWTPEPVYPFFRISDIGLALPWLVPDGKSQITCDIGCTVGDNIWNADEASLTRICLEGLDKIVPGLSTRFLGARIIRTPIAYPVFLKEYEPQRRLLDQATLVEGLVSIGRNGEFKHILMEDVYWRTRRKCSQLLKYLESETGVSEPSDYRESTRRIDIAQKGVPAKRHPTPSSLPSRSN